MGSPAKPHGLCGGQGGLRKGTQRASSGEEEVGAEQANLLQGSESPFLTKSPS